MNLYHCLIELKSEARALAFATAVQTWMSYLQDQGLVTAWRLMRRKFGLASGAHCDFLLEIELPDMAALDNADHAADALRARGGADAAPERPGAKAADPGKPG